MTEVKRLENVYHIWYLKYYYLVFLDFLFYVQILFITLEGKKTMYISNLKAKIYGNLNKTF